MSGAALHTHKRQLWMAGKGGYLRLETQAAADRVEHEVLGQSVSPRDGVVHAILASLTGTLSDRHGPRDDVLFEVLEIDPRS